MSRLAQALSLRHPPLALYYTQDDPPEARRFKKANKGGWGCALFLLSQALQGRTISYSADTCQCPGAASGMGLAGDSYEHFPGGREAFARFLSSGNQGWEEGRAMARKLREGGAGPEMVEEFLAGEGFKKCPELALDYVRHIPAITPKGPYVVVEPLSMVPPANTPEVVIMLADAGQLSALVYQANFARKGLDNVRIPFASGCQTLGLFPLFEATREQPRAVAGLTDISARLYMRQTLGRDLLSFAMPWGLYQEMEENVGESFFTRQAWKKLQEKLE